MNRLKKAELRREMKQKLALIDERSYRQRSESLVHRLEEQLLPFIQSSSMKILGGFAPIGREPLWWSGLEKVLTKRLAFPGLQDKSMSFYLCDPSELEESREFNVSILTPPQGKPEVCPDVLLIPGLAFAPSGIRLGRGGGYYDRYLENFKGLKLGICFSEQLQDSLINEDHDQKVDMVITDRDVFFEGSHPLEEKKKWI